VTMERIADRRMFLTRHDAQGFNSAVYLSLYIG
jgi:hypothetical protein